MKTNALIQHLETQNCKKCKVKGLCDQAGGDECLLPKMAALALRDLTESLRRLQKDKADLQHNLMIAESEREYHRSRADFFREVAEVGNQFISVEGFKAFRGTMRITPNHYVGTAPLDLQHQRPGQRVHGCQGSAAGRTHRRYPEMSKSSKRPMKSWFNAKNAAAYRRQRNREYTTRHEEVMAAKREERQIREMEEMKRGNRKKAY